MNVIISKMESANSIAIDVDVKAFGSKGGKQIFSTKASLIRMKGSVKNVLAATEIMDTPEYFIKVDREEKAVLISKKDSLDKPIIMPELSNGDIKKIKAFLEDNSSQQSEPIIKLLSNTDGVKKYSIQGIDQIREMQIHLNTNLNKIIKITYEYGTDNSSGQYVVLTYTQFQFDKDQSSSFNLDNYFTMDQGNYVLNDRLKGYKIYTER